MLVCKAKNIFAVCDKQLTLMRMSDVFLQWDYPPILIIPTVGSEYVVFFSNILPLSRFDIQTRGQLKDVPSVFHTCSEQHGCKSTDSPASTVKSHRHFKRRCALEPHSTLSVCSLWPRQFKSPVGSVFSFFFLVFFIRAKSICVCRVFVSHSDDSWTQVVKFWKL